MLQLTIALSTSVRLPIKFILTNNKSQINRKTSLKESFQIKCKMLVFSILPEFLNPFVTRTLNECII